MQGTMPGIYTQARKTTHALGGQHQHVDRTPRGRVSHNDRGQRWRKYVHDVATSLIKDGLITAHKSYDKLRHDMMPYRVAY